MSHGHGRVGESNVNLGPFSIKERKSIAMLNCDLRKSFVVVSWLS